MRPVSLDSEGRKRCTQCKDLKHFSVFYTRSDQPGKYMSACKDCRNAKLRAKAAAESTAVHRSTITIHPDGYALVSLHGQLGEGKFSKIDIEDIELISPYKWGMNNTGYARGVVVTGGKRRDVLMHRWILGTHDEPPNLLHTDHRYHDKLDNRRSEIRKATPKQNGLNSRGYGASGFKGVYAVNGSPNWQVNVSFSKSIHFYLGTFANKEDAARVYDGAARALFGEFAFTNFEALPMKQESHPL